MNEPTLAQLAAAYAAAKQEEVRAAALRRGLATQIQSVTGWTEEGGKTFTADGWKVVVKQPLIRSMDWAKWDAVKDAIPESLWPVEMKPALDEKGVKWLQTHEPEIYAALAPALTVKPGAVQVTVQAVGEA